MHKISLVLTLRDGMLACVGIRRLSAKLNRRPCNILSGEGPMPARGVSRIEGRLFNFAEIVFAIATHP